MELRTGTRARPYVSNEAGRKGPTIPARSVTTATPRPSGMLRRVGSCPPAHRSARWPPGKFPRPSSHNRTSPNSTRNRTCRRNTETPRHHHRNSPSRPSSTSRRLAGTPGGRRSWGNRERTRCSRLRPNRGGGRRSITFSYWSFRVSGWVTCPAGPKPGGGRFLMRLP
jgi:hypothetical protein